MSFFKRPPRTARNVMMDLLARRDHSEKELRQKLARKEFPPEEIDRALQYAVEKDWLKEPTALAGQFADVFHRKSKGIHAINQKLKEKGLPSVRSESGAEIKKAQELVQKKLKTRAYSPRNQDFNAAEVKEIKARLGRFLQSRGFELSTIRKVVHSLKFPSENS